MGDAALVLKELPAPGGSPPPSGWRRWTFRALTRRRLALGMVISIAIVLLMFRSPAPLASVKLTDDSRLELRAVTSGDNHRFVARPAFPANPQLRAWTGHLALEWAAGVGWGEGRAVSLWLTRHAPNGDLVDLVDLAGMGNYLLVDSDGWGHLFRRVNSTGFRGNRFRNINLNSVKVSYQKAPNLDVAGKLRSTSSISLSSKNVVDMISGVAFPQLPPQQAQLHVLDRDGSLLGTLPVKIPADPAGANSPGSSRLDKSLAQTLPVTQEAHGLAVTLEGVQLKFEPEQIPGLRLYEVVPQLRLSWQGGDAAGWSIPSGMKLTITDAWGNKGSGSRCGLSPYSPVWKLEFEVPRTFSSPRLREQEWKTWLKPAAPGEIVEVEVEQTVGGHKVRLLKLVGAGKHDFKVSRPNLQMENRSARESTVYYPHFGPEMPESVNGIPPMPPFGWVPPRVLSRLSRQQDELDLSLDLDHPALLIVAEPLSSGDAMRTVHSLFWRSGAGEFRESAVSQHGSQEATQLLIFPLEGWEPGMQHVEIQYVAAPTMKYEFIIKPPALTK